MAQSREELIAEVTHNGQRSLWDAHDQGRLAFHDGVAFEDNPFRIPTPGYFHVNMGDWERGYQREAIAVGFPVLV